MVIVNGFQSLTIITKHSNLDVAAVLDPPMINVPLMNSIYLIFCSLENPKRTRADQSILHVFFFAFSKKEATHEPSIVATANIFFSSQHVISATCFDEWFLFHVITGRHCLL